MNATQRQNVPDVAELTPAVAPGKKLEFFTYFFFATTFDFESLSTHFTVALVCAATLQLLLVAAPRQEIRHI